MSRTLQRVFLLGLISHVLAFSTMFLLVSSIFTGGPQFVASFFPTGLLLAVVAFFAARRGGELEGFGFLVLRVLILLGGVASMFLMQSNFRSILIGIFLAFQLLLLRRMIQMVEDLSFVRRSLFEKYQKDIRLFILFGLAATFLPTDPSWQLKALPFVSAFLLTRMFALSTASRMTKHVEGNEKEHPSLLVKWQGKTPFLLFAAALLGGWILSILGVPMLQVLDWVVTPIFYALGWVVQLAMEAGDGTLGELWIAFVHWLEELFAWLLCLFGACEPNMVCDPIPQEEEGGYLNEGGGLGWTLPLVILASLFLGYTLFRMFKNRRVVTLDGGFEIREFIWDDTPKPRMRFPFGNDSRTKMRKIYRKFLFAMKKQGYVRYEGDTALEYINKIAVDQPDLRASMQELTDYYMQERYGGQAVEDKLTRSEQLSQELNQNNKRKK